MSEQELEELQPPCISDYEDQEGTDFIAFYEDYEEYELEKWGAR